MKTSLIIDDTLFKAAQKDALKKKTTLSSVINDWARLGRAAFQKSRKSVLKRVVAVDLGGPASLDVNSRKQWMDLLDE